MNGVRTVAAQYSGAKFEGIRERDVFNSDGTQVLPALGSQQCPKPAAEGNYRENVDPEHANAEDDQCQSRKGIGRGVQQPNDQSHVDQVGGCKSQSKITAAAREHLKARAEQSRQCAAICRQAEPEK